MRTAVTEGDEYMELSLGILTAGKNRVTMIDRDKESYERVYDAYDVDAILDDPYQEYMLEKAGMRNFDAIVALGPGDMDNSEICQMGKEILSIHKTLCLVRNPRDMELFEKLEADQAANMPAIIAGVLWDVSSH